MISNEALTNAVRSLNFTFKKQTDRMMIWRKRGSPLRVQIRRNAYHTAEYAGTVLRQAGMSADEIEAFLRSATVTSH